LKLDGFVIDHLPFEHELTDIVLLICGEKCMDAGLRAPRTGTTPHNSWSMSVNNATSHCLIQWPNWTGIFDPEGEQRDQLGHVVAQELGVSTPYEEYAPGSPTPLTEAALTMKNVGEVLDIATKRSSYHFPPTPATEIEPTISLDGASNASTYGSTVASPFSTTSFALPQLGLRFLTDESRAPTEGPHEPLVIPLVQSIEDSESPTTADGSGSDYTSASTGRLTRNVSKADPVPDGFATVRATNTQGHRARRSLNWLTGPT
jgi:hypothetical protein